MRYFRRLAALVVRGPDRKFVRHDLEDMYVRDRANRVGLWRAYGRYGRRLAASAVMVWRDDLNNGAEWLVEARRGTTLQDLRFALRLFRKHPAPVSIAVGGLALAIGVVASVFSIVDATLLRQYAMDDPSSVVSVNMGGHTRQFSEWPYSTFLKMQQGATLSRVEASQSAKVRFGTTAGFDTESSRRMLFVSGGYLQMFGGRPSRGRTLAPSDDFPGAPAVVVISHRYWMSEFGGDASVLGRTLWLNDSASTIVGVLQQDFTGPVDILPSVWAPLALRDEVIGGEPLTPASTDGVDVIARMAPGATLPAAQANLLAIVGWSQPHGTPRPGELPLQLASAASPLDSGDAGELYLAIGAFFVIVGLVLAVACANTANLLLAAATRRTQEMGVRLAMGANTRRLIRQLLNESLLLGAFSGGLGFVFAMWFAPILSSLLRLSPELQTAPDGRTLLFVVAVSLLVGLGVGLSPARQGARSDVLTALKSEGSWSSSRSRLRTSFVGFQAAVSMLLLVSAALLARTAIQISRVDPGFDADRLLKVEPERQPKGFDEAAYTRAAADALRRIPSIERVSVAERVPWHGSVWTEHFVHNGRSREIYVYHSDSEMLRTLGARLLRGRSFTEEEANREAPVALVSESVARSLFAGLDPIGQSLSRGSMDSEPATIIGVVADAMLNRNNAEVNGAMFRPIHKARTNPLVLLVRTPTIGQASRVVVDALRRVNPQVRVTTTPVRDRMDSFIQTRQMLASLSAPLAILTVLLAGLGVFGVTAFAVGQRSQEVSVRLAMGASTRDVLRLLVKDSLRPVMVGSIVGLVLALVLSRISASQMLGGLSPYDPVSIGVAVLILTACALVAAVVPARRASKADPAVLLRQV